MRVSTARRVFGVGAIAVGLVTFQSPLASATEVPHKGFYLRGQLGLAGMREQTRSEGNIRSYGGAAWGNVEVGATTLPDLIVFAKLWGLHAPNPTFKIGDTRYQDTSASMGGAGGGVTYYFATNAYVSGALTFAKLSAKAHDTRDYRSDIGLLVHAGGGFELPVSQEFGLGLGAEFALGSLGDKTLSSGLPWTAGYFVIAVTATYN